MQRSRKSILRKTMSEGMISHKKSRSVRFQSIEIREFARTLGEHPCCTGGPPISISWEYEDLVPVNVEDYEQLRPPRRGYLELAIPRKQRWEMMEDWGVPRSQCVAQVRTIAKIKHQRRQTVIKVENNSKVDEKLEKVGRKLGKMFSRRKSTSTEVEKLMNKAKLYEDSSNHTQEDEEAYDPVNDPALAEEMKEAEAVPEPIKLVVVTNKKVVEADVDSQSKGEHTSEIASAEDVTTNASGSMENHAVPEMVEC